MPTLKSVLAAELECECCSRRVDLLHDVVLYSDFAVAKALMVSEVAQIAKLEQRGREFLLAKWRVRAQEASRLAGARVASGGTLAQAFAAVDREMGKWATETAPRFSDDAAACYRLARKAGAKKASGKSKASLSYQVPNFTAQLGSTPVAKAKKSNDPSVNVSFDLVDRAAVAELKQDCAVWIGRHYDANVRATVRSAVLPSVIQGLNSKRQGEAVQQAVERQLKKVTVPGGFNGSDAKYFEGLAANVVTQARVTGQVRSFQEYEVLKYEIVNPMDDRTSRICQHMNGKVFYVSQAISHMESLSALRDPTAVKNAAPWLSLKELLAISPTPGNVSAKDSAALAAAGFPLPPFHWRCRTTVDISY